MQKKTIKNIQALQSLLNVGSEDHFNEKFQNEVDWEEISMNQKLSEPFIRKFSQKIVWNALIHNRFVGKSMKNKLRLFL